MFIPSKIAKLENSEIMDTINSDSKKKCILLSRDRNGYKDKKCLIRKQKFDNNYNGILFQ
jgi:hypothetical protein